MKPHTKTNNVVVDGIEAKAFTIKASGKAFRILIDGIYADKIKAPVRELMSNAWDAHKEAGTVDTPFDVTVPTDMDPTFGVRDYGTGMTDDQVMGLYTTLFGSSREGSNDAVGMLGLGSKSPFAYTDSFTVSAYDGESKRTYMAYVENDVPMIALAGTVPCTESRGIQVRFPVQRSDVRSFVDAVRMVALGFDVTPNFDTDTVINMPTPIMSGNSWKLYNAEHMPGSRSHQDHMIRQGCVLYPVPDSRYASKIPYGMALVVDVPVGTVDVATSRESLSFDTQTQKEVTEAFAAAWEGAKGQVSAKYEAQVGQLAQLTYSSSLTRAWRDILPRSAQLMMFDMMPKNCTPEQRAENIKGNVGGSFVLDTKKNVISEFPFQSIARSKFIIDNVDAVRRRSRIVEAGRYNSRMYVIPIEMDQKAAIAHMKKFMGVLDEQFVKVKDLPDNHDPRINTQRPKMSQKKSEISNGGMWVIRSRSSHTMPGTSSRDEKGIHMGLSDGIIVELLKDTDWKSKITYLTDSEFDKINPPIAQSFGKIVLDAALEKYKTLVAAENKLSTMQQRIKQESVSWEAGAALVKHIAPDLPKTVGAIVPSQVKSFIDSNLKIDYDGIVEQCEAELAEHRKLYPRLFNLKGFSMTDYIKTQDKEYAAKEAKTS